MKASKKAKTPRQRGKAHGANEWILFLIKKRKFVGETKRRKLGES